MEPNDPIWKLLDRSPLREPDAWFAARTVARLRREAKPAGFRRIFLLSGWVGVAAAVALLVVNLMPSKPHVTQEAKIRDALNYIADRGTETDLWLATTSSL